MTRRNRIRVLVIDDSAFSRQAITRMLETSPLIEVVGIARRSRYLFDDVSESRSRELDAMGFVLSATSPTRLDRLDSRAPAVLSFESTARRPDGCPDAGAGQEDVH